VSPHAEDEAPAGRRVAVQALLIVLSLTAGCSDVIGLMGLNGLFTAHITGNLVVLAAHVAAGEPARVPTMLAVPVFIVVAGLTIVLANGLEAIGLTSLRPLLLLQFLLLTGFLLVCAAAGPHIDPDAPNAVAGSMLGVSAMAVQNALVQISIKGAPATAVMTSNATHFALDIGTMLCGGEPADVAKARERAAQTLPVIVGFAIGCGLGAACEMAIGLRALILPTGLALLAFAIGFAADPAARRAPHRGGMA
jgi:uncharacterized membrane protein YoaK (UPF0700 family)